MRVSLEGLWSKRLRFWSLPWPAVPLVLATLEAWLMVSNGLGQAGSKEQQLSQLAFSLSFWLVLAATTRFLFLTTFGPGGVVRAAARTAGAVLWFLVTSFAACSWVVFKATGSFLTVEHVRFLLRNTKAVFLHLLQTSGPLVFLVLLFFALLFATTYVALVRSSSLHTRSATTKLLCLGVIVLGALSVLNMAVSEVRPRMPLTAIVGELLRAKSEKTGALQLPEGVCLREKKATPFVDRPQASRPPVIFVLVESLRFDLLERFPEAVPFLRDFSRKSVLFEKAYTPSTHSDYADLAIWYSMYPLRSGLRNSWRSSDPRRGISFFRALKSAGYKTAYFSSQNERWGDMINWLADDALDKFFHAEDSYGVTWENWDDPEGLVALIRSGITRAGKVEDSETLERAFHWVASLPPATPFALGLNLQNTHFSYVFPAEAKKPFGPDDLDFRKVYYAWPKEKAELVKRRYLNAVYNVDHLLASLASRLKAVGVWDKAIVVIAGDNGEAFYEHGFGNHSGPAYDECARVVALLKLPGQEHQQVFRKPISLIDLPATVLEIATGVVPPSFQGVSVFRESNLRNEVFVHVHAFVVQDAVVDWPWKLLYTRSPQEKVELYNLENDPLELCDLAERGKDVAAKLLEKVTRFRKVQLSYNLNRDLFSRYWPPRFTADEQCRASWAGR